ncbi:hypothetical protein Xen7305DRAFT_00038850 [Xenococcus sp. PCC 7305]|uniref:hypothetical protein n=1 Tax=Xenococcus sp. PCC 7305 TaxID=102125 RepID=UPI0002AC33A0|nr:hypothetical protein [Xenococcus sp. PCC 7305]ELS04157.1 hypothetical protein Xen7305DRAFT_00038850 [Xenococcus sp. PCC 7305]
MCQGWKIEKWETPLSAVSNPAFESLIQDKEALKINIRGDNDKKSLFIFDSHCPAYKSIDETYKTKLWSYLDETDQRFGSTFTVKNSSWLKQYQEPEFLTRIVPDLKHYVICTTNNIIEILTDKKPQIIESNS